MSKENSHLNEFLTDPEFVRWVRDSDKELEVYWLEWMQAHPHKRQDLTLAREIIQGFRIEQKFPDPAMKHAVLSSILNSDSKNIRESAGRMSRKTEPYQPAFWNRIDQFFKVAAILVLSFALSFTAKYLNTELPKPMPLALVKTINKATANGEKLNVKLPDGSMVWLNAGSELQYPEKFDSIERIVHLKGEAFFEVEKGIDWPFSVVSDNLITTALGTSFNIEIEEDVLSISLVTGKVKVENGLTDENVFLLPGQQLKYAHGSKKTVIGSFDVNRVTGWKAGLLQFTSASFDEVRKELEKWYGVTISVSGTPARKWNLTGAYQDQNLEMVLERISYIEQLNFTINDNNVQIKF